MGKQKFADALESEAREKGANVLETKVYVDTTPLLWTDIRIEVIGTPLGGAVGTALGIAVGIPIWLAIILVCLAITAVIVAATLAFKTVMEAFKKKPGLEDVKPAWGVALITKEEWDRMFFALGPMALGAASVAVGLLALTRSSPLGQVYYQDGQYLVSVRYPGQWNDIREFVQPSNPDVVAVYSQYGPTPWSLYDFVCRNIDYSRD
ncbi:unnamed protein product, partial [marine sediment metagenome]